MRKKPCRLHDLCQLEAQLVADPLNVAPSLSAPEQGQYVRVCVQTDALLLSTGEPYLLSGGAPKTVHF